MYQGSWESVCAWDKSVFFLFCRSTWGVSSYFFPSTKRKRGRESEFPPTIAIKGRESEFPPTKNQNPVLTVQAVCRVVAAAAPSVRHIR